MRSSAKVLGQLSCLSLGHSAMYNTMLADVGYSVLALCILTILDTVRSSRPRLPSHADRWLSRDDIMKARARWTAAMLIRTTDDEDLVLSSDDGSGWMMQRDGTGRHNSNTGSRKSASACCRVGKIAGTQGKSCSTRFYVKQLRTKETRHRLNKYRQRLKLSSVTRQRKSYNLMNKFQKCAIRRKNEFQKCCSAGYFHKRRRENLLRHRNRKMFAKFRLAPRYKRKRRRYG